MRPATVLPARDRWVLEDLDSSHGTFVNRLSVKEKILQPGDQIRIGDETISFFPDAGSRKGERKVGGAA